jgi:hypothetical protein
MTKDFLSADFKDSFDAEFDLPHFLSN